MAGTHYLGRFIDFVGSDLDGSSSGGSSGSGSGSGATEPGSGTAQVYGHIAAYDCGPAETDVARLIDMVRQPLEDVGDEPYDPENPNNPNDPDEERLVPVYGQVTTCQKDWVGSEEYIAYDFGGGLVRDISKEMTLRLIGMDDCFGDGTSCVFVQLEYDPAVHGWTGSTALPRGTAAFNVFGTEAAEEEAWWLEITGCPGSGVQPLTASCRHPLRLGGTAGGGTFGSNCCPAVPPPSALTIWAKIPPVYLARLVDMEGEQPVYLAAEPCDDGCPFTAGCCDGVPIDETLNFTIFDIVTTSANPPCTRTCTGSTVSATTAEGCVTWSVTTCSGPHTICLECDLGASAAAGERGWEHYRIAGFIPTTGSCNPFSVTFVGLPWTSPDPGGECSGTYSVTVTN